MDTKERHIRENESKAKKEALEERNHMTPDEIAQSMPAEGKENHRKNSKKTNRLWLWLGVIVLVFIIIYWLFTIGVFESITGVTNG
ncbi:MAG: hypothetical protein NC328_00095 [Muribaculum sp.]|nr:hypothetical protein [Muribaculum sp.]